MKRRKGFTLIELMIVVVIIGILAAVALPRFMTQQRKAKESAAWADLDAMTSALEMYYLDCNTYPVVGAKAADGLDALVTDTESVGAAWAGPYIKYRRDTDGNDIPEDPYAREYMYEGSSTAFTVWCKGADGTNYSAVYINPGWFKSP